MAEYALISLLFLVAFAVASLAVVGHRSRSVRDQDRHCRLAEQASQSGKAEKYARGMLKLITERPDDLLDLKRHWWQPIR
jgi:hypothetical protein